MFVARLYGILCVLSVHNLEFGPEVFLLVAISLIFISKGKAISKFNFKTLNDIFSFS